MIIPWGTKESFREPGISKKDLQTFFQREYHIKWLSRTPMNISYGRAAALEMGNFWAYLPSILEGRSSLGVSGWKLLGLPKAQLLKMYYLRS